MSGAKRHHVLEALTLLSKYLGIYKHFKELREAYGIKWSVGNSDQLVINRLLKRNNGNNLEDWVREVSDRVPRISNFVDLIMSTGLRYIEALNCYNLVVNLERVNRLENYYSGSILEHYKYPRTFIRRTKKVFISIASNNLVKEISETKELTDAMIKKGLQRRKIPLRFGDLREYWASKMTRYLSQPEIDFLMGHVSANVFMANYFNPFLINDLKKRALEGISELISF